MKRQGGPDDLIRNFKAPRPKPTPSSATGKPLEQPAKKKGKLGELLKNFKAPRPKPTPSSTVVQSLEPPRDEPRPPILGGVLPGQTEGWRRAEVQPRTVWSFWHSGSDHLPSFYSACVASWRMRLSVAWEIRVLNMVEGDPDNIFAFLTSSELPNRFRSIRPPQHQADLLRLALLDNFGGVWCDVGILLFESLDPLWNRLVDTSNSAPETPLAIMSHGVDAKASPPDDGQDDHSGRAHTPVVTGGFAHFYLREWGSYAYDRKDFVEVWFLAVGRSRHPVIHKWRTAFASFWHNRESAGGAVDDPFFAHVGLGPGSAIPAWGWDYLGMAHTYKKLIAEDAECRACWSSIDSSSSRSSSESSALALGNNGGNSISSSGAHKSRIGNSFIDGTCLLDAVAPSALRLGELRARTLRAIYHRDHGAAAVHHQVLAHTPMLKFNGKFVGELKDLPGIDKGITITAEATAADCSSSSSNSSSSSSKSHKSSEIIARNLAVNLPRSTLRRLLLHALRPPGESSWPASAGAMHAPLPMTWDTLLDTAEPPRSNALPALKEPIPF